MKNKKTSKNNNKDQNKPNISKAKHKNNKAPQTTFNNLNR